MTISNKSELQKEYQKLVSQKLNLDMSRGKPEPAQLDLSLPMLHALDDNNYFSENGMDVRNYGEYMGIPEARRLFAEIFDVSADQVIVGGNSSINMISDAIKRCFINGAMPGAMPWCKLDKVKFICPVPGYDWHFHICDTYNIEMLPVSMDENGPDMNEVEELITDNAVKGMIVVPMYSNPTGITFSESVVERLAKMDTAAKDFRLFWDNAYCVHHLFDNNQDNLANIYNACVNAGNEDRVLMFTSTSKITFAGSGICAMAGSLANIGQAASLIKYQLICYDNLNQLRHARFLPNMSAVETHMKKHADILRPKFEIVLDMLERELGDVETVHWQKPKGGYFICLNSSSGCAKRIVQLCAEAGVKLTPAGAPFPHGLDPDDSIIRIAPTCLSLSELEKAIYVLSVAVKLAIAEKLEK